jgi:hypothetical protein
VARGEVVGVVPGEGVGAAYVTPREGVGVVLREGVIWDLERVWV